MGLVSKTNFKLAAVTSTREFMIFAKYFGIYDEARKERNRFVSQPTYNHVEFKDAENSLKIKYERSVTLAINKLFLLDKAFYKVEQVHIIAKLDCFGQYEAVLENIDFLFLQKEV